MTFFRTVVDSINSQEFYKTVPKQSFWKALRYFLTLSFFLVLIQSLYLIKPFLIDFNKQVKSYIGQAVNYFPLTLSVSIKNGHVTTNMPEPYFIKFPLNTVSENSDNYQNLIVIDTKTSYSADQFASYDSAIWLTSDSIFIKSEEGVKTVDLSKVDSFTLDRNFVDMLVGKITPFLGFFGPTIFLFMFLGIYLSFTSRIIYLLVLTLVLLLIAKSRKWPYSYGAFYKIGMYGMTLGLIIDTVIAKTQKMTGFSGFPFLFSLITLGVIYFNLSEAFKKSKIINNY